ncbi:uncharacterized protein FOMMEDRAFT_152284 [Fomitiporia mediterranea MF3/22]|uniref:uncharacterized protein n=1 Tax=Fomitiporia mediterranea (strain MF3/22) TaxID=694068 RepID=UPI0004407F07|nr:uncharacterized protein FOMMEDRAFT_152284 [Fomitiporia mediterranea MF3/22]EJD06946.1 hypothetical protein FOMMEDRAFT_152284 [Fomitiporia mediterranea MF3/22]
MPSIENLWTINTKSNANAKHRTLTSRSDSHSDDFLHSTKFLAPVVSVSLIGLIVAGIILWKVLVPRLNLREMNKERSLEVQAPRTAGAKDKTKDDFSEVLDIKASSTEDDSIPVIVITRSEVDLCKAIAPPPNTPDNSPKPTKRSLRKSIISNASSPHDASIASNALFFTGDMCEEMSTIATNLKRFSFARSNDVEVNSVDSEKSSVFIVESESKGLLEGCTAENVSVDADADVASDEMDSVDKAIERLEELFMSLQVMINDGQHGEACIDNVPAGLVESASISPVFPSFSPSLTTIAEEDIGESSLVQISNAELSQPKIEDTATPPGTPLTAITSSNTSFNDEETLAGSTPEKKDELTDGSPVALISVLASSPAFTGPMTPVTPATASSSFSSLSASPFPSHSLESDVPGFLSFTEQQVPTIGGDITNPEDAQRHAQVRYPLGEVRTTALSNGVVQPLHPTRREHMRTSSRDKSENRSNKNARDNPGHGTTRSLPPPIPRAGLYFIR